MTNAEEQYHGREMYVFGDFPDTYYVEEFDGGMPITHESYDSIVSLEDATRVEMVSRYDTGFTWEKLTAVRGALRQCVWTVLIIAVVAVWYVSNGPYALAADAPVATLRTVIVVMLSMVALFQIHDLVKQLRIVYRLRGVAEETPLDGEHV